MVECTHDPRPFRVCVHLLADDNLDYLVKFTGRGVDCAYICRACAEAPGETRAVCEACRDEAANSWDGIVGSPEIAFEPSAIAATYTPVDFAWPELVDLQPILGADCNLWLGVGARGTLYAIDLDNRSSCVVGETWSASDVGRPMLRISRDGKLAALVERTGNYGVVVDVDTARPIYELHRDGYRAQHCVFPVAFIERDGRQLVVHSPAWNRLDIVDPRTREVLTERPVPQSREAHALDYFHCGLDVSPDQRWIADHGWVWGPAGIERTWSIDDWLANEWESEDGPSVRRLCQRHYYWDGPACWLDNTHLAVYGYGGDEQWLIPAVRIFDVTTGVQERWFPGPDGDLYCDRELYAVGARGTSVWNVARGTCLHWAPALVNARYHPSAKCFVSIADGTVSVFRAADARWNTGVVRELAAQIARERGFTDLPVLGDALEAAGCDDAGMLAHCQSPGPHGDRCWVLDRLGAADH